jgi:anti-sigma factor RsiW
VTCEEARDLLNPDLDGELDLVRSLEVERHLAGCAACAQEAALLRGLRSGIGEAARFYPAPAALEARVRRLAGANRTTDDRQLHLPPFGWGLLAAAAAVALFAIILRGRPQSQDSITPETVTREVVADHIRSLMADHLIDVLSSNQHTVKPWFEGKLDYSPAVADLSSQGFSLVGGRLDYLDGRPVSAIVYKRRAHVINLFVWPAHVADTAPAAETRDGYNLVHWNKSGMSYCAVSSLGAGELMEFVGDLNKPVASTSATSAH